MKFYFTCLENCYKDFGWNLYSSSHSWIYPGNVTWMQAAVLILAPSNLVVPAVLMLQVLMAVYQIPLLFFSTCSFFFFIRGLAFLSS